VTPVVYIGGCARSGSTLLERMLAAVPGYCPVGELVFVWERGLARNDLCGCGERFRDCGFWSQVGKAGFGGWDRVDTGAAVRLRRAVDRHRNLAALAGLAGPGKLAAPLAAYAELTGRLYQAVREVSGAEVIVDSSKHVGYALLLRQVPGLDVRLAHLVRRSHGVAHSWAKRVRKPSVGDGTTYMSVHPAWWSAGLWMADNLLFEVAARRMPHATRVRYEDLAADPRAQLRRVMTGLGLPRAGEPMGFLDGTAATLGAAHALSGNPMRLRQGTVGVRVDDEWRAAMSRPRRAMVTAATWPLLLRYGYRVLPGGQPRP
jgi:hypothetical protein